MLRHKRLRIRKGAVCALLPAVVAACGSLPPPVHEEPVAAATLAPTPRRATHYGGPAAALDLADGELALAGLAPRCAIDPRLVQAARAHAADLSSGGAERSAADLDHLRFGILWAGGFDYGIQPFVTSAAAAGQEALARFVERRGSDWSHCGVGIDGDLAVWIGVTRLIALEPLPVSLAPGSGARVVGHVRSTRVTGVSAYLGLPDGGVRPIEVRGTSPFEMRLPPVTAGRYELELLVDAGGGPEVAALLPLWVGLEPDRRPLVFHEPSGDGAGDPEVLLYELVGEVRRRAGLEPLRRDAALEDLARSHSTDMARRGFFGHVSPATGSLADRLAARGLRPSSSAENVARSSSVRRAHRNLVLSPSHRMHLIDPGFTHVGIGTTFDQGDVIVTQVFARW